MDAAMQHYLDGMKLFGQGENEQAIAKFDEALVEKPDWADVLLSKATCLSNLGRHDAAIKLAERVTELEPDEPLGYTSLSMFHMRLEHIEEAEKVQAKARMVSWKKELKTNPDAPPPMDGPMNGVQ